MKHEVYLFLRVPETCFSKWTKINPRIFRSRIAIARKVLCGFLGLRLIAECGCQSMELLPPASPRGCLEKPGVALPGAW
jgi:hypothetical protein